MKQVEVDDDTHERLMFGARVAGLTVAELIRHLVLVPGGHAEKDAIMKQETPGTRVFVSYRGRRVDGVFDVDSERLTIVNGPPDLVGRTFKSPTKAAVEVVKAVNPGRLNPQTNGWRFWRTTDSGQVIDQTCRTR